MAAISSIVSDDWTRYSKSLLSRRLRLSQAIERSTIQVRPTIFKARWAPLEDPERVAVVALQMPRQPATFVAGISDDGAQTWKGEPQTADEPPASNPVGDTRWLDAACEWQTQRVDENVALAALDLLVPVETFGAAAPIDQPKCLRTCIFTGAPGVEEILVARAYWG